MVLHESAIGPAALPVNDAQARELRKRGARWRFFQVAFFFLYLGIVLDVITTALGFERAGSQYEQNPLGGNLIGNLGWIGLMALLTALCAVCYLSFRIVFFRMALRWSRILNAIVLVVLTFRWITVVAAVVWLLQPS